MVSIPYYKKSQRKITVRGKGARVFVFYDTETTGIDVDFTQILQIGMLFTDDDFNILSIKKIDSRNSPWDLPSPGAMLTTGFTPDNLKNSKNSNFEMMQEVDGWLRGQHWPLTFVGYNSLGYDEPILAQNFYQNLLPPGLTTSKNSANGQSNGRADIMRMVEAVALYMPGALKLDIRNPSGTPSMTLKNVARQNGVVLSDAEAHDALNDIKATVGLAKVIRKVAPQIWEQALKLTTVESVNQFLATHEIFTYARFMYGRPEKTGVMTSLGERAGGTTQMLFDLRFDPTPYMNLTTEQLKCVFLAKKGAPFVLARKGEQPLMMPLELSDAVLTEKDDIKLYEKRAKALKADPAFLEKVARAAVLAKREQLVAAPPGSVKMPEPMIDKKVPAAVQKKLDVFAAEFRNAENWSERAALAGGFNERFKDELAADPTLDRFEKLASRLVYEHAPQELTAARQLHMKKFIAARLLNPDLKAPYMTIARARLELEKIEKLRADPASGKWQEVADTDIRKLKLYYTALEKEYTPFAHPVVKPVANDDAPTQPQLVVKKPDGPQIQPK